MLLQGERGNSIAGGQPEIENNEVGMLLLSHGDGGITFADVDGVEVIGPQTQTERLSEIWIVIHDHDLRSLRGWLGVATLSYHFSVLLSDRLFSLHKGKAFDRSSAALNPAPGQRLPRWNSVGRLAIREKDPTHLFHRGPPSLS